MSKVISRGLLFSLPMLACEGRKYQFFAFRIHEMRNTNEKLSDDAHAAIKLNLDVQFLFMDKPFGYWECLILLVFLWSIWWCESNYQYES